jgi:hypothetical protein
MFGATAPLLDDPAENLLAVSAFNDNGLKPLVDERESATATVSIRLVSYSERNPVLTDRYQFVRAQKLTRVQCYALISFLGWAGC